jgi:hypothetical protein
MVAWISPTPHLFMGTCSCWFAAYSTLTGLQNVWVAASHPSPDTHISYIAGIKHGSSVLQSLPADYSSAAHAGGALASHASDTAPHEQDIIGHPGSQTTPNFILQTLNCYTPLPDRQHNRAKRKLSP